MDAAGEDNEACVYDHGFKVYHCPLAFDGDFEYVYGLYDRCHIKFTATAKKVVGRNNRKKTYDDKQKVYKHDLLELKLVNTERMITRKNQVQRDKKIPAKYIKYQKQL